MGSGTRERLEREREERERSERSEANERKRTVDERNETRERYI